MILQICPETILSIMNPFLLYPSAGSCSRKKGIVEESRSERRKSQKKEDACSVVATAPHHP